MAWWRESWGRKNWVLVLALNLRSDSCTFDLSKSVTIFGLPQTVKEDSEARRGHLPDYQVVKLAKMDDSDLSLYTATDEQSALGRSLTDLCETQLFTCKIDKLIINLQDDKGY